MKIENNLQEAVVSLINSSLSAFEKGAGFLQEEIPQVVQQLLMWEAINSFISFMLGVILLIALTYFNYKQVKWWNEPAEKREYNEVKRIEKDYAPVILLNAFQIVLYPLFFILASKLTWLKIWIAPKVFLIEYAARLIK